MGPHAFAELAGALAVFFAGSILLVPIVALSVRYSLKPLIEARARLQHGDATEHTQDRRIALLEAELQSMQGTLTQLQEAEEFRRQLSS